MDGRCPNTTHAVHITAYSIMKKSDSEVNYGQQAGLNLNQQNGQRSDVGMSPFFASQRVYLQVKANPNLHYGFVSLFSKKNRYSPIATCSELRAQDVGSIWFMEIMNSRKCCASAVIAERQCLDFRTDCGRQLSHNLKILIGFPMNVPHRRPVLGMGTFDSVSADPGQPA